MLKRGRPCIVRHDECERATGNLSSRTTEAARRASGPGGLPSEGASAGAAPRGRGVGGKAAGAAGTRLAGAGHAWGQPLGNAPERARRPSQPGGPSVASGGVGGGGRRKVPLASQRATAWGPVSRCKSPGPPCAPGSSPGRDSTLRVSREGDKCHTQSPCTHVPWRGRPQAGPSARVAGGTENRPSVLYSSLIKRTHHRQPLLKYPDTPSDGRLAEAVLRADQIRKVRGRGPAAHAPPGPSPPPDPTPRPSVQAPPRGRGHRRPTPARPHRASSPRDPPR